CERTCTLNHGATGDRLVRRMWRAEYPLPDTAMSYTQFPTRFGKYILLDRLNSGGMAEVYRAKVTGAERFQRLVAIKCMLPALNDDEQFITMFVDEAKLAAQLSHANIVQIYELGRIAEQLYIAMELIHGRDLRHVIKRVAASRVRMPIGFASYVISKAAEGLDFAHRKIGVNGSPLNLVHRDVSPQNILVSFDGEVKVVDFGIAKAEVRDTVTRAGVLKGKFAYMAPEQVMGGEIDRRADVFALGAVLYEVLIGKKLFRGESDFSILEKVRAAEIPRISDQIEGVPAEIDHALARAMARDTGDRYAWASDFAEDLVPLLIQERSIFGTKQAKEFMQHLYADDIALLAEQLKKFSEIQDEDCFETSAQRRQPRDSEVFESTLDEEIDSLLDGAQGERQAKLSAPDRSDPGAQSESSGWTAIGTSPAFGEEMSDATELLSLDELPNVASISRSKAVSMEVTTEPQPGIRPKPYEDSPSVPASGLRSGVSQPGVGGLSRPIFHGLVAASVFMLAAVVAVVVYTKLRPSGNGVTELNTSGTSIAARELNAPSGPPDQPPENPDSVDPPPRTTVVVGSGSGSGSGSDWTLAPAAGSDEPTAVEPGGEGAEPDGEGTAKPLRPARKKVAKPRTGRGKSGYVTIFATGVKAAKVFIDGKEIGYAPIAYRKMKIGKHRVRVVEDNNGKPGKTKLLDVMVSASNTRSKPLKLKVDLE
ncbi:MAG: serine/threonine-protein kinase, partial [Myxococcota bacterium]